MVVCEVNQQMKCTSSLSHIQGPFSDIIFFLLSLQGVPPGKEMREHYGLLRVCEQMRDRAAAGPGHQQLLRRGRVHDRSGQLLRRAQMRQHRGQLQVQLSRRVQGERRRRVHRH